MVEKSTEKLAATEYGQGWDEGSLMRWVLVVVWRNERKEYRSKYETDHDSEIEKIPACRHVCRIVI